jgi:hypothetical protein
MLPMIRLLRERGMPEAIGGLMLPEMNIDYALFALCSNVASS